jgi:predicted ATPase
MVAARLERDAVPPRVSDLVLAALDGEARLGAVLAGASVERATDTADQSVDARLGLFLGDVSVTGFRGISVQSTLRLRPMPGLTLVVGRNGSGKSTFAEAAELSLVGTCSRWADRTTVDWRNGWRNLHHDGERRVQIELRDDSGGSTKIERSWPGDTADVDGAAVTVSGSHTLDDLALDDALDEFRPILSYNELGEMLHKRPVELHDAIGRGLGTEEIDDARERLRKLRLDDSAALKDHKKATTHLADDLAGCDDARAATIRALLVAKPPDFAAVTDALGRDADDQHEIAALEMIVALQLPSDAEVAAVVTKIADALDERERATQTVSQRADLLTDLLTQALSLHDHHPEIVDCPLCGTGGVIDDAWATRTETAVAEQQALSRALRAANQRVAELDRESRDIVTPLPAVLLDAAAPIELAALRSAWQAWAELRDEPDVATRSKQLDGRRRAAAEALELVQTAARDEFTRRSAAWAPFVGRIGTWLDAAADALALPDRIAEVTAAEQWMRDAVVAVRGERLAPILDRVREIWDVLRRDSNVELAEITLGGAGTSRRATIGVTVDDEQAVALSVMSQGELHALALSLFLPRATLESSPFRFVIIDDPVQAMDAARVEGLARVLDEIARTRQVVVFTHDERLPRACRHLGVGTRIIEVTRDAKSVVTTCTRQDPADDLIEDARRFLKDRDIPNEIRERVVPGLCRQAIEAAAIDAVWRRGIRRAKPHGDIEAQFDQILKLKDVLALALFGDDSRAGDVLSALNRVGPWAADAVQQSDKGMHGEAAGVDLEKLVNSARKLIDHVNTLERA